MDANRPPAGSSEPVRDVPTVADDGAALGRLPHGVQVRDLVTHTDDRGTLFELYDERWGFHELPLTYAYVATIRPGVTKGWALHEHHDDRYTLLFGALEVVLYDAREDSPTHGLVAKVVLTEHHRRLLSIPIGIWHADRNLGDRDVVLVNFPTTPFDKARPDKQRLPLDTPAIPYRFPPGTTGW
jgi:dTDP-4-dehydrorhamnose 3,5-epimerase